MAQDSLEDVVKFRAEMKTKMQNEFIKQYYNPYRHVSKEKGETLFDPAIQRFMSARACQYEFVKSSTPKARMVTIFSIIPFAIFAYFAAKSKEDFANRCATGQIPYKDRKTYV